MWKAHSCVSKPTRDRLLRLDTVARMSSSTWADSLFARRTLPNRARRYIRSAASKSSFEELFDLPGLTVPLLVLGSLWIAPACVSEKAVVNSSSHTAGAVWCFCSSYKSSPTRLMWSERPLSNRGTSEFTVVAENSFPPGLLDEATRGLRGPVSTFCTSSCNSVKTCKEWAESPISVQAPRDSRRGNNIGLIKCYSAFAA